MQKQVSLVQWASTIPEKFFQVKSNKDRQASANKFINSRHVSSKVIKLQSRFIHALEPAIGKFYANREGKAPLVYTTENFEKASLWFLRLSLPSTLISHKHGAFRKRSSNRGGPEFSLNRKPKWRVVVAFSNFSSRVVDEKAIENDASHFYGFVILIN